MAAVSRKAYPGDLTDEQWELIEILIPAAKPGGRPRGAPIREVVNALLYLNRSGCQRDMLPHDLPAKSTVDEYFEAWCDVGTWQQILDHLRGVYRELAARSEEPTPSAASIDSQTVKTTGRGGVRGYDGGKKITGRKRNLAVDTLGLLLAVVVTSAALDDAVAAPQVLARLARHQFPRLQGVWEDSKYHNHRLHEWLETHHRRRPWRLEIVSRPQDAVGFVLLPKRRVVERNRPCASTQKRLRTPHRLQRMYGPHDGHSSTPETISPANSQTPFNYRLTA